MRCPKCQFENPATQKFCGECGSKLEKLCPKCGSPNPSQYKFCGECGHDINLPLGSPQKEISFDEKLAKIQKYLPQGLTEKILSQKDRIEGERKQVTVMFCDMEGFTSLLEKLDIEEAYSIMDQVYEILIHKVHDFEGTVNEMTGDGILALFGAPIALEDAPQRAIRSATAIHREMARFSATLRERNEDISQLRMRIGIHTGPVVVGTLGNDLRVEFKAVGDTVNLASRVENLSEPGTTNVTEETFKLTEGYFRFEALGKKKIRGKEEPVGIYRVIAPSTRRTRFDVSAERGLTRFVGRERELELLLDGFKRSKKGQGQAFSIVSEAGLGKSRLLYEFRKSVANEDITFLEGKCLSYSKDTAYHAITDVLKSTFDIQDHDGDLQIIEKVQKGLKILGTDESSTLPFLLELLSVQKSGIDSINMSPESKKDRTMEALKRITLQGAEIRPLIMALEDLHWSDKSSGAYVKYLLDSISGARIFLIFTYRPEFIHTWGGKSYHSQVNLNRLSNRESLAIVSHLLGTEELDRQLEDLILEKTEGVPFYVEEFIKSLKDLKIIERKKTAYHLKKDLQAVTIPSSIQDVIMARVDTLPDGAKELLQLGSVIEREFTYELIKQVSELPEKDLLSRLSVLKDSELIYERGIYPDSTYIFKHALTQEVVYDSILTRRKKQLHNRIGEAIEKIYKDYLLDYNGVLAEHFIKAENYQKGAEYSIFAAKKAEKKASFFDAISYANKGITSLEKLPKTDKVEKTIIDARTILGLYYLQVNYFVEAKEAVEPIAERASRRDYKRRLSQIYTILGTHSYIVEDNFAVAFNYLSDALMLSRELNDILSLVTVKYWSAMALSIVNCEFEKALHYLQNVLQINVEADTAWGISLIKSNMSIHVNNYQGKIDLSYQNGLEAIQIAKESGDVLSRAAAYTSFGASCCHKGFLNEAEENLIKGAHFCEKLNLFVWGASAYAYLGDVYYYIGEYQKSKDYFEKSNTFLTSGNLNPCWIRKNEICIERAKVKNKEKTINLEVLYNHYNKNKWGILDGWMARNIGEVLLNLDGQHTSEAENWIKKAIEGDKNNSMMWYLALDYALYAEVSKLKGDLPKTKENLSKAIEIFNECGADGWVEKYEKELAEF